MGKNTALIEALGEVLGPHGLVTDQAEMAPRLSEERGLYRGEALAVACPSSTSEVAQIVRLCADARVPVVPQGGNTGLVGGGVPLGGVVVSLERMNRVLDLDAPNMTMTVEAGCVLENVRRAAAAEGLLFPVLLASAGSCQIGGNLSTNAGGTEVLRYGNTREQVLGVEVVLPDGRVLDAMSRLRKDNTGYDLKDLFIGAEGTLGIITAAVLRLVPAPRQRCVALVACQSSADVQRVFGRLNRELGVLMTGFEYLPRFGVDIVQRHIDGIVAPFAELFHSYGLIELTSPDPQAPLHDRLEQALAGLMEKGHVADAVIGASESQNDALWRIRETLPAAQKFEGGSIKHDVSVPVARTAEFIERATQACEAVMPGIRVCAFGHFGDGNIHFNLTQPEGMEKAEFLEHWGRFNRLVHRIVAEMGGSISAEHGIGLLKRDELPQFKDAVALDLMRTLKRAIDPHNIMNPGKVLDLQA